MGALRLAQGKLDAAEALYREALERSSRVLGDDHPERLTAMNNMGVVLQKQAKFEEALPLFEELYRRAAVGRLPPADVAMAISGYGPSLATVGKYEQAFEPLTVAYEHLKSAGMEKHVRTREVVAALARVCHHANRPGEAARWRAELAALEAATRSATNPATISLPTANDESRR
jgi:tetratricopeptide (TPR) repeat protein